VEPEEEEREVEVATPDPPGDTGTEPEEEEVEVDVATPIPLGDVDVSHGEREADLGVTTPVSPRDAGAEGTVVGDERESDENEGGDPEAVGEVDDDVTLMGTDEHVEPEVSLTEETFDDTPWGDGGSGRARRGLQARGCQAASRKRRPLLLQRTRAVQWGPR